MKTPVDAAKGKIVDYDERSGIATIKVKYDDIHTLVKRQYKECYVEMIDSRPLSDKQRRTCWMLIGAISDWQGQSRSETARDMANYARKVDFLINEIGENADRLFSLSNAPMSLVSAYQRYLVRFVVEHDIPVNFELWKFIDDIADYIYSCLIYKKCAVCGKPANLHHVDRVGMGRDRHDIIHEGMEVMPLCPGVKGHHDELHTLGDKAFFEKYHFDGGIVADKTICKIYKLKARKDDE